MALNFAAARAYAARNPDNTRHAELLARLDPEWATGRSRPPLDLTAARARIAERRLEEQRSRPPLNLAPIRAAQEAERNARRVPVPPETALKFVGRDGAWQWVSLGPGSRRWERLAKGLVAASPFRCLRLGNTRIVEGPETGHSVFKRDDDGTGWVDVFVDDAIADADRVIAHELAHVADEIVRIEACGSATAWHRQFDDPHRSAEAEAFAVDAEAWLRIDTPRDELLAAARRHQDDRRAR
ncbi:hypothetical protein [Streptomyces sp. NBC_01689]|uniref:hypothetical protein n=1 Tax=Streptomyces sp. NBC_01689 TaxID=2975911 RepID=UPI002E35D6BE|nr:hypothetical protein [Streptomyces sp. NBC_01689]